jgi:RNA polymerase sigma-70 factor, ECF subfamily
MATQQNTDEIALIKLIAEKDQGAMTALYDRYARVMYAIAFKILGTPEESEEAVLDVFHQVWRTAGRYDPKKARVDTWLFMQIRSRCLDRLRVRQRAARVSGVSLDAVDLEVKAPTTNAVEDVVIVERRNLVVSAIKQLPIEQRQVIELAYFKGLTQAEIACQTGIALGTIKTRIRLGLSKLRVLLGSSGYSELG